MLYICINHEGGQQLLVLHTFCHILHFLYQYIIQNVNFLLLASGASLPSLLNYPNFPYIYIYNYNIYLYIIYIFIYTVYIFIYIFQAVRRARAVNALRANVGPAGSGSTVNIIALKTATLVLSCS